MDRRVVCFIVAVGMLLLSSSLFVLPHAADPTYRHAVHAADAADTDRTATVAYATLSPATQAAFDDARSTDGVLVERTADPAFEAGRVVVVRGDDRFLVRTTRGPASTTLVWLKQSLTTFGVALCGAAGVSIREGRRDGTSPPLWFAFVGLGALWFASTGIGTAQGAVLLLVVVAAQFAALWWGVATATGTVVPRPLADD
ncbi:hypothetical protein [Halogeometricum limi]|uniref:DUF7979 domain-containing protein n=1 Tax=Halogeometricum limi TaxID=555875 RepID=A0A1I6FU23_9EURY|nr:hypothetical protein [Halogeometricum limi]SFR33434.1 hypothetical protein SAMN04488124_0302 [Halogeometricum limi]